MSDVKVSEPSEAPVKRCPSQPLLLGEIAPLATLFYYFRARGLISGIQDTSLGYIGYPFRPPLTGLR